MIEVRAAPAEELEIQLLLEAIRARYGYDFRGYGGDSIRRRLQGVLARTGAAHLGELQHRVLTEPAFFAEVLDTLTVQVSDLFRDPEVFRALREEVLPHLRTFPHIKIWHAGCATGEEVWSTAILLEEEGLYDRAQLYATDLSPGALERAKDGVYPASRAAQFARNYEAAGGRGELAAHVSCAYDHVAIREPLRRNVLFFQHDLATDASFGEMHVIFCRNVLIYFGAALRARVLDLLHQSLHRGGFLCLGASERIRGETELVEVDLAQALYRRSPYHG
jgi:chemotaxis protein methyltransferase CheR